MKRRICYLLLCAIACGCTVPYRIMGRVTPFFKEELPIQTDEAPLIHTPSFELPEYERLIYRVSWAGITVGTLTASINGIEKYKGKDVYNLEVRMKTNAFLSMIYKIDDRFVSYMDVEKKITLRQEVYRREGHYKKDAVIEFDQESHTAYFKNTLDGSEFSFPVPQQARDVVSTFYYLTLIPFKVADAPSFFVTNSQKNYHVFCRVTSAVLIKTLLKDRGTRKAFVMAPFAELNGKKVEKGSGKVYYSLDKRRLPLLAVLKAPIFTQVTISLVDIEKTPLEK